MTERLIIAMTGLAQSGKDTVGEHLATKHGFARDAFADDIRRALYAINPQVMHTGNPDGTPVEMLADFVDRVGWKEARKHPVVHGQLQRTGTEAGWMIHGESLWIDRVAKRADALPTDVPLVITDCRTAQESAWVRERGGYVVRVDRAGQDSLRGELAVHTSETQAIRHRFLIVNNDSIASLHAQTDAVLDMIVESHKKRRRRRR